MSKTPKATHISYYPGGVVTARQTAHNRFEAIEFLAADSPAAKRAKRNLANLGAQKFGPIEALTGGANR